MNVGILTPYTRTEITAAALRLADLVLATGHEVELIARGAYEESVHPFWDSRVHPTPRARLCRIAIRCNAYIHFLADSVALDATTLVHDSAPEILVPNWTVLNRSHRTLLKRYSTIVCPTKAAYKLIRSLLYGNRAVDAEKISWCRWESGVEAVRRDGTVADNVVRVAIWCDSGTIDRRGPIAICLAMNALEISERVQVTLLSAKSWARSERRTIGRLVRKWGSRLACRHLSGATLDQMAEFHAHDWVIVPADVGVFGTAVMRAHSCGAPVIAHDIEPFSELITSEYNGLLVPCELESSEKSLAPVAAANPNRWMPLLRRALSDNSCLFRMQGKDWRQSTRRKAFDEFWIKLLGLTS